jgi:hypothetical protein
VCENVSLQKKSVQNTYTFLFLKLRHNLVQYFVDKKVTLHNPAWAELPLLQHLERFIARYERCKINNAAIFVGIVLAPLETMREFVKKVTEEH